MPAPTLRSRPAWIEPIVRHFGSTYRRPDGLLMISVDPEGAPVRDTPVIADLGDILPFLDAFGEHAIVDEQLELAKAHLWRGLYQRDGRVELFLNHDWLLGLLDLARRRDDGAILDMVREASATLRSTLMRRGFLIDEVPEFGGAMARLWPASPFNGGFIELWVEEAELTGEAAPLDAARRLGEAWIGTETFRAHGLFEARRSVRLPALQRVGRQLSGLRARLFKDNTNLLWGLLTLGEATGEPHWRAAVDRWLEGFRDHFFGGGMPFAYVDRHLRGHDRSLKAAFSALDLLTDLHAAGVGEGRALDLAREVAASWLALRWDSGLFPAAPGADRDHLDANVDMAVALVKLAALAPDVADEAVEAAAVCRDAVLRHHLTPAGYAIAVGPSGAVVDGRVLVKYQALLTKLALLPDDPADLAGDADLLSLLRDR